MVGHRAALSRSAAWVRRSGRSAF